MSSSLSFIKRLDFLGGEIRLRYQDETKLKTNFGGMMSILISFLFVLLIIGFGQDFFARKNPTFIKSSISLDKVPMYSISNDIFSLAFRLENMDNNLYNKDEMFEIVSSYILFTRNNDTGLLDVNEIDISLIPCTNDYFPLAHTDLDGLMCVKFNDTLLGGSLAQGSWGLLEIYVATCQEGKLSSKGKPCSTTEQKIKELDGSIYFSVYIQKSIVNPDDYHGGLKSLITSEQFRLNGHLFNYMELFFAESMMETDYGWLLTSISTTNMLGLTAVKKNFSFYSNLLTDNSGGYVGGVSMNFIPERDKYFRKYPKAQDLAAQVGGILKIFLEIGYFIVGAFSLNYCQLGLSDYLLNFKETGNHNTSQIANSLNQKQQVINSRLKQPSKEVRLSIVNLADKSSFPINQPAICDNNNINASNYFAVPEVKKNNLIKMRKSSYDNIVQKSLATNTKTDLPNIVSTLQKEQPINKRDVLNKDFINKEDKNCHYVKDFDIKVSNNYLLFRLEQG